MPRDANPLEPDQGPSPSKRFVEPTRRNSIEKVWEKHKTLATTEGEVEVVVDVVVGDETLEGRLRVEGWTRHTSIGDELPEAAY